LNISKGQRHLIGLTLPQKGIEGVILLFFVQVASLC
jgi:hypothetical protein